MDIVQLGKNIRLHREIRNITREQLAEILSMDVSYLGQCERGERQLGLSKITAFIDYFAITPNDIIPYKLEDEKSDINDLINTINSKLCECSYNQCLLLNSFIDTILPFIKK